MYRYFLWILVSGIVVSFSPVFAAAQSLPYVSAQGLVSFAEDSDAGILTDIEFDTGYGGALAFGFQHGYRFSHSRTEIEVGYRNNDIEDVKLFNQNATHDGEVSAISVMANGIYVFETRSPVKPYLMGGLGAARVELDGVRADNVLVVDDEATDFAYQVGLGLDFWLTESLAIDVGYRYFRVESDEFENEAGDRVDFEYETQNATLGVRYTF